MDDISKNRFISLLVENQVGVLAKVSGLFSGKFYNLKSLTVGTTEADDISRMTICVDSTDSVFEQIKKQLNAMVEVIKVVDLSETPVHMKELLFAKLTDLTKEEMDLAFKIAQAFEVRVVDIDKNGVLIEALLVEHKNDDLTALLKKSFKNLEIARGGSVAIESISTYRR